MRKVIIGSWKGLFDGYLIVGELYLLEVNNSYLLIVKGFFRFWWVWTSMDLNRLKCTGMDKWFIFNLFLDLFLVVFFMIWEFRGNFVGKTWNF